LPCAWAVPPASSISSKAGKRVLLKINIMAP
jgi:hypothetical protein